MAPILQASAIEIDELETRFGLQEATDDRFFWEWQTADLPEITEWEKEALDRLKWGYFNLLKQPPLLENTVRMSVLHPLLFIANFYLAPLSSKPEQSISIALEDEAGTIVEGRIDVLVWRERLWLMAIEAKRAEISLEAATAQLIAYMFASPNSEEPTYGMLTNGGCFMFAKIQRDEPSRYAFSDMFALRRRENELYCVLKILKYLSQL